jgi:hypothetical protein
MLALWLSVCLRVSGTARYASDFVYVGDFGFYAGGTIKFSWLNKGSAHQWDAKAVVMSDDSWKQWYVEYLAGRYSSDICTVVSPVGDDVLTVFGPVPDAPVQAQEPVLLNITKSAVYVMIIQNCDDRDMKGSKEGIYVNVIFSNPNGQHLDSRDVPSLAVVTIMIALFGILIVGYVAYLIIKMHRLVTIHFIIGAIVILYILYLTCYEAALKVHSKSDDRTSWSKALIAFETIYTIVLFSFLMIASGGWPILHVEVKWYSVLSAILSVGVFMGSIVVSRELDLRLWVFLVLVLEGLAMAWILRTVLMNTRDARQHVKAHLYVIQAEGIDPRTTPVWEKFRMYNAFMYVVGFAFAAFFLVNIVWIFLNASNWVTNFVSNLVQLGIILMMMNLYRPRGRGGTAYFARDQPTEGEERRQVLIEEVDLMDLDSGQREGMRDWDEGVRLPLEPVLVKSDEKRKKSLVTGEGKYTAVTDV